MKLVKSLIAPTLVALGLIASGNAAAQEKLTVWWVKGFYKAEDDALFAAIKKFEDKHKDVKIELSQYPVQDMIPKTVAALDSGSPPDVAYADVYDFQVTASGPSTASWKTSPACHAHARTASRPTRWRPPSSTTTDQEEARLLRLPDQAADHAHRVLARHAGRRRLQGHRHPEDWKGYWDFWCEKVQPASRQKSGKRNFGIGMPMGVDSSDAFYSFLTFMDAYNVKLVNDNGKLLVDDPRCAPASSPP
jgi:multiple sugar transport system substrate-binding protein